jgi:hypothetical protein
MADNQAGIMTLPENQDMQKLSIYDSYDATNEALTAARPDVAQDIDAEMAPLQGIADDLTDEQLDLIIELVQYLYENKEEYAKNIAELSTDSGLEGVFPPEYDPEFLTTFGSILLRERKSRGADQPPFPEKFALGGIADAARIVANQGRYGDTMLAHITPEEARMLRRQGGSGTINPVTGLPEYWNPIKAVKSAFKSVAKGVSSAWKATVGKVLSTVASATKKVLASPIGRMAATIALTAALGPSGYAIMSSTWAASAAASATVTLASGGSAKDALKAAAFSAIAAPDGIVGSYIGPTTQAWAGTNEFAKAAMQFGTSAAATTTAGLLTGQNLEESVKQGLTSAAIATGVDLAQKGVSSFKSASDEITAEAAKNQSYAKVAQDTALRNAQETGNAFLSPSQSVLASADDVLMGGRAGTPSTSTMQADAINAATNFGNPPVNAEFAAPSYGLSGKAPGFVPPSGTTSVGLATPPRLSDTVGNLDLGGFSSSGATPVAAGTPTTTGGVPEIGASIKKIGGGIADFAQGNFKQGFNDVVQGGEDLFFPSGPSPEQVAAIEARLPNSPKAAQAAIDKITPGTFRTYGPGTAAALGIAGLSGAFDAPEPPPSEQRTLLSGTPGEDRITANPADYVVQGMPGINYGEKGEILAPSPQAPRVATIEDIRVAPSGDALTMQDIARPTTPYGMDSMQAQNQEVFVNPFQQYYEQQYLPSQYRPRYYAMGGITSLSAPMQAPPPAGIASLRDGGNSNYPRRTGQIAGPGTEKSDSIPAMLSDGEFVMTAAAVRGLGKGSRREGAKRMYALMHQLERNAARG